MYIGPRDFVVLTGHIPHQDDLDRANCPDGGKILHTGCGVCPGCNRIRWNVCVCGMDLGRREEIEFSTANERGKVISWLKQVDDILEKEYWPDGKDIKWDTIHLALAPELSAGNLHDYWHDSYSEGYTPETAVRELLEWLTSPQYPGNLYGLVLACKKKKRNEDLRNEQPTE